MTQLYSPEQVSIYNITFVLFNVVYSIFASILAPLWSRYTIENEKKNYIWIKNCLKYQLRLILIFILGILLLSCLFLPITKIWLHRDIDFPRSLIISMAIYTIVNMFAGIFATFLNGTGNINIELLLGLFGAIINIPLSVFFAKYFGWGLAGVCMATIVCQLPAVVVYPIWVKDYLGRMKQNVNN